MIETTFIDCFGAQLEVPVFLKDLWPHELPLKKFPTFCGAGKGFGDSIVPDTAFFGTFIMSPACFIHDICFAICEYTEEAFDWCNEMFLRNLKALADAQLWWLFAKRAYLRCDAYYLAVQTFGWLCFKSGPGDQIQYTDHMENPVVKDRLHRLACASLDIPTSRNEAI